MECPICGYVLDAFTQECPRCVKLNVQKDSPLAGEEHSAPGHQLRRQRGYAHNTAPRPISWGFAVGYSFTVTALLVATLMWAVLHSQKTVPQSQPNVMSPATPVASAPQPSAPATPPLSAPTPAQAASVNVPIPLPTPAQAQAAQTTPPASNQQTQAQPGIPAGVLTAKEQHYDDMISNINPLVADSLEKEYDVLNREDFSLAQVIQQMGPLCQGISEAEKGYYNLGVPAIFVEADKYFNKAMGVGCGVEELQNALTAKDEQNLSAAEKQRIAISVEKENIRTALENLGKAAELRTDAKRYAAGRE